MNCSHKESNIWPDGIERCTFCGMELNQPTSTTSDNTSSETDLPEEKKQAIRPEELRIGNLVTDEFYDMFKREIVVESVHPKGININPSDDGKPYGMHIPTIEPDYEFSQLRGIPLSPEWLERLGFKDRSGTLANRMAFGITLPGNVLELAWYIQSAPRVEGIRFQTTGSGVTYDTKITTVHGLQNLFYSLTGEELKLGGVFAKMKKYE